MNERRYWVAVLGDGGYADLQRHRMRELPIVSIPVEPHPAVGDRVAVLHRGCFAETAVVTKITGEHPLRLRLRHSVDAPAGTTLPYTWFSPALGCAMSWTDERLDDLIESFVPIDEKNYVRIEDALRSLALQHGPRPSRPAHRRPRTPGRRKLVAAKATAFRR